MNNALEFNKTVWDTNHNSWFHLRKACGVIADLERDILSIKRKDLFWKTTDLYDNILGAIDCGCYSQMSAMDFYELYRWSCCSDTRNSIDISTESFKKTLKKLVDYGILFKTENRYGSNILKLEVDQYGTH